MKRKVSGLLDGESNSSPLICDHHDILIVGDGDFSFSYDIVEGRLCRANKMVDNGGDAAVGYRGSIVATSFDSKESLGSKYGVEVYQQIEKLSTAKGVKQVLHGVDGTDLEKTLRPRVSDNSKYDRIVFNFPLVPLTESLEDRERAKIDARN